jgi:hypothetical protein
MSFLRNPDTISRIIRARLRDLKRENEEEVTKLLLNCQTKYVFYNGSHLTKKYTSRTRSPVAVGFATEEKGIEENCRERNTRKGNYIKKLHKSIPLRLET